MAEEEAVKRLPQVATLMESLAAECYKIELELGLMMRKTCDEKEEDPDYRKVPKILREFTSEDDDPEMFVADFNSVLECLNEEPSVKTTF